MMAKHPTPESIAADLTAFERVLLFCLASNTDWTKAGVRHVTAQTMLVRRLIERTGRPLGSQTGESAAVQPFNRRLSLGCQQDQHHQAAEHGHSHGNPVQDAFVHHCALPSRRPPQH
jgi:hypothetical protein